MTALEQAPQIEALEEMSAQDLVNKILEDHWFSEEDQDFYKELVQKLREEQELVIDISHESKSILIGKLIGDIFEGVTMPEFPMYTEKNGDTFYEGILGAGENVLVNKKGEYYVNGDFGSEMKQLSRVGGSTGNGGDTQVEAVAVEELVDVTRLQENGNVEGRNNEATTQEEDFILAGRTIQEGFVPGYTFDMLGTQSGLENFLKDYNGRKAADQQKLISINITNGTIGDMFIAQTETEVVLMDVTGRLIGGGLGLTDINIHSADAERKVTATTKDGKKVNITSMIEEVYPELRKPQAPQTTLKPIEKPKSKGEFFYDKKDIPEPDMASRRFIKQDGQKTSMGEIGDEQYMEGSMEFENESIIKRFDGTVNGERVGDPSLDAQTIHEEGEFYHNNEQIPESQPYSRTFIEGGTGEGLVDGSGERYMVGSQEFASESEIGVNIDDLKNNPAKMLAFMEAHGGGVIRDYENPVEYNSTKYYFATKDHERVPFNISMNGDIMSQDKLAALIASGEITGQEGTVGTDTSGAVLWDGGEGYRNIQEDERSLRPAILKNETKFSNKAKAAILEAYGPEITVQEVRDRITDYINRGAPDCTFSKDFTPTQRADGVAFQIAASLSGDSEVITKLGSIDTALGTNNSQPALSLLLGETCTNPTVEQARRILAMLDDVADGIVVSLRKGEDLQKGGIDGGDSEIQSNGGVQELIGNEVLQKKFIDEFNEKLGKEELRYIHPEKQFGEYFLASINEGFAIVNLEGELIKLPSNFIAIRIEESKNGNVVGILGDGSTTNFNPGIDFLQAQDISKESETVPRSQEVLTEVVGGIKSVPNRVALGSRKTQIESVFPFPQKVNSEQLKTYFSSPSLDLNSATTVFAMQVLMAGEFGFHNGVGTLDGLKGKKYRKMNLKYQSQVLGMDPNTTNESQKPSADINDYVVSRVISRLEGNQFTVETGAKNSISYEQMQEILTSQNFTKLQGEVLSREYFSMVPVKGELTIGNEYFSNQSLLNNFLRSCLVQGIDPDDYMRFIQDKSKKTEFPIEHFMRLIPKESTWSVTIKSPMSSAYGIGQVIDDTWEKHGAGNSRGDLLDQTSASFSILEEIVRTRGATPEDARAFYNTGGHFTVDFTPAPDSYIEANSVIVNKIPPEMRLDGVSRKEYFIGAVAYYCDVTYDQAQEKSNFAEGMLPGDYLTNKFNEARLNISDSSPEASKSNIDLAIDLIQLDIDSSQYPNEVKLMKLFIARLENVKKIVGEGNYEFSPDDLLIVPIEEVGIDTSKFDGYKSHPAERNPNTGTTLCSKTARLNLESLGVPSNKIHRGTSARKSFDMYSVDQIDTNFPNSQTEATVADFYFDASNKNAEYGHRVIGIKKEGSWYILDPYYKIPGYTDDRTQPILASDYIAQMQGKKGRKLWGAAYFK